MNDTAKVKIVRDAEFARRLATACDNNSSIPAYNYGRLKWVKDHLKSDYKLEISLETTRKWFAGEARPRPDKMAKLAALIAVDEAWLSLGKAPHLTMSESKNHGATASGIVHIIAGYIQISGGTYAFPTEKESVVSLSAIIKGRLLNIHASLALQSNNTIQFRLPAEYKECNIIIGALHTNGFSIELYIIKHDQLKKYGHNRGGFIDLPVEKNGTKLSVGNETLERITSLEQL